MTRYRKNLVGRAKILLAIAAVAFGAANLLSRGASADSAKIKAPATAAKPSAVFNAMSALMQTSAIIEGTVADVASEYTPETGPWTRYDFTDVAVHRGSVTGKTVSFVQKGGSYPNGRQLVLSTNTQFMKGARYVVFLRNTSWNLSPVVGEYAFRVEKDGDAESLVGSTGGLVVELADAGVSYSAPVFSRADLNGAAPARLADAAPAHGMSVQGLVKAVDGFLAARNVAISGSFYNEPVARQNAVRATGLAGTGPKATDTSTAAGTTGIERDTPPKE